MKKIILYFTVILFASGGITAINSLSAKPLEGLIIKELVLQAEPCGLYEFDDHELVIEPCDAVVWLMLADCWYLKDNCCDSEAQTICPDAD